MHAGETCLNVRITRPACGRTNASVVVRRFFGPVVPIHPREDWNWLTCGPLGEPAGAAALLELPLDEATTTDDPLELLLRLVRPGVAARLGLDVRADDCVTLEVADWAACVTVATGDGVFVLEGGALECAGTVGVFTVGVLTVGVLTVGVLTVGVLTVGVLTVGVLTVGVLTVVGRLIAGGTETAPATAAPATRSNAPTSTPRTSRIPG
jgi:hypothetical protein